MSSLALLCQAYSLGVAVQEQVAVLLLFPLEKI